MRIYLYFFFRLCNYIPIYMIIILTLFIYSCYHYRIIIIITINHYCFCISLYLYLLYPMLLCQVVAQQNEILYRLLKQMATAENALVCSIFNRVTNAIRIFPLGELQNHLFLKYADDVRVSESRNANESLKRILDSGHHQTFMASKLG